MTWQWTKKGTLDCEASLFSCSPLLNVCTLSLSFDCDDVTTDTAESDDVRSGDDDDDDFCLLWAFESASAWRVRVGVVYVVVYVGASAQDSRFVRFWSGGTTSSV